LNVPWIAVPFERISATFPDCTCLMKVRAVRDLHTLLGLRRPGAEPKVDGEEREGPTRPTSRWRKRRTSAAREAWGLPGVGATAGRSPGPGRCLIPGPDLREARRRSPRQGPCPRRRSTRARCERREPPVKMFGVARPHLGERRAVGPAADRGQLRLEPDAPDRLLQVRNDLRMLLERVAHVAVLDLRLDLDRAAFVGRRDVSREPAQGTRRARRAGRSRSHGRLKRNLDLRRVAGRITIGCT